MSTYGPLTLIWTNIDTLQGVIRMSSQRATAAMGGVVDDVLEDVYAESQVQVPVDTGSLRSSGHIDPLDTGPGLIKGTIGYGAPYAFFVHEDLHARHPHGGKAKFLEDPMKNALNDLTSKLRSRLEAAIIGQGVGAGSKNQTAEGESVARQARRRAGARRSGASHDHITEMLNKATSYGHVAPSARPMIAMPTSGGAKGAFHYDPRSREVGGRIPRQGR